jgi:hypothetical protein
MEFNPPAPSQKTWMHATLSPPSAHALSSPTPGSSTWTATRSGASRHASLERLQQVAEQEWGRDLIRGWNENWWEAPIRIGEKIAGLVGAAPGQMVACDTVSVNLFKLASAALALRPGAPISSPTRLISHPTCTSCRVWCARSATPYHPAHRLTGWRYHPRPGCPGCRH